MYISTLLFQYFLSIWVSIIYCSRLDTDCRAVCQNTAPVEPFNADFNITSSLFHSVFIHIRVKLPFCREVLRSLPSSDCLLRLGGELMYAKAS